MSQTPFWERWLGCLSVRQVKHKTPHQLLVGSLEQAWFSWISIWLTLNKNTGLYSFEVTEMEAEPSAIPSFLIGVRLRCLHWRDLSLPNYKPDGFSVSEKILLDSFLPKNSGNHLIKTDSSFRASKAHLFRSEDVHSVFCWMLCLLEDNLSIQQHITSFHLIFSREGSVTFRPESID